MEHSSNGDKRERSRSRSRKTAAYHECSLALTQEQIEQVQKTGKVLREWFGEGHNVPVKNSLFTAVRSFAAVIQENPLKVVTFRLSLAVFHEWVDAGIMEPCPWVNGYRMKQDIDLNIVDPMYTLRSVKISVTEEENGAWPVLYRRHLPLSSCGRRPAAARSESLVTVTAWFSEREKWPAEA